MKKRDPQLALRLDAEAPDNTARWHDGQPLAYLGGTVTLRLDTRCKEAVLEGGELHLPLPPEATSRLCRMRPWLARKAAWR